VTPVPGRALDAQACSPKLVVVCEEGVDVSIVNGRAVAPDALPCVDRDWPVEG
jgi:hypothetical protein